MKKTLFAVLVTVIISSGVFAATTSFTDVSTDDWFYNDVMNMVEWDVIRGYPDGTFGPANQVNRAELSAMWNRYDKHVDQKMDELVLGSDTETLSTYIGDIYLGLAYGQISQADAYVNRVINSAFINTAHGTTFPTDCSRILSIKDIAEMYLEKAKLFPIELGNSEQDIYNSIDNSYDACLEVS